MKKDNKVFPAKHHPVKKYYVFNQTGNIMLTTIDINEKLSKEDKDTFAEVSVFFAGMTKAISTTINPTTKKPYSIYNYSAIKNIVSGSGLFIHITTEDIEHTSNSTGIKFSSKMVKTVLGLQNRTGPLPFAQSMTQSIGQECVELLKNNSDDKAANIFFVCEYLLGLPIISVVVVHLDPKTNRKSIELAPCESKQAQKASWMLHKDTYLFVTPNFIKRYTTKIKSITGSEVTDLAKNLKELLK